LAIVPRNQADSLIAYELSREILHAIPEGALEAVAEFFGDVVDGDEGIAHGLVS